MAFCATVLAGLSLASCGGGDPYAGLWTGTLGGNRQASAIVLDDGAYYMLYSRAGDPSLLGGMLQGSGDFHSASFTSTNARNYNWEVIGAPAQVANLSGKVGGHMTVAGSVNGSTPFSVKYEREFDGDPRLSVLAGSYTGNVVFAYGVRPATMTVTAAGQVSTNIDGCSITGQVAPRRDANVYDLTVAFGGLPCIFPFVQFTGVTVYREDIGRLEAAVAHASRTQGIGFMGARQ